MRIVVDEYPLHASDCPFFDYGCTLTGDACKRHPREYEGEIQSECDQLIEFETLLKRGD